MIVLDTHTWVWWISDPDKLSLPAKRHIDEALAHGRICISSISTWEIMLLVSRNRLVLSMEVETWIKRLEALSFVRFVPVDNAIAIRAVRLPEPLHPDPADRIIIATALQLGATLITKDQKIRDYPHVTTVW